MDDDELPVPDVVPLADEPIAPVPLFVELVLVPGVPRLMVLFTPDVLPLVAPDVVPVPPVVEPAVPALAPVVLPAVLPVEPVVVLPEDVPLPPMVAVLLPGWLIVLVVPDGVEGTIAPPLAPKVPVVVAPWPVTGVETPAEVAALLLVVAVLLAVCA